MNFRCLRQNFESDQKAATAVEFALVGPVLFLLIFGIVEFGLCFTANIVLQNAIKTAARTGRTGYVDDASTRDATVRRIVKEQASVLLDYTKIAFTSKAYGGLSGVGTPEPFIDANGNGKRDDGETYTDVNGNGTWDEDSGVDGYGGASQIVVYTASYPWAFFTPLIGKLVSTDGTLTLTATAVIQNEPY
jgi:hypothetical protein